MDNAQKIKDGVDIIEHISKSIELKRTGKNLRGICPFHGEKTPSFFVSPDRQTWHCFGCDKGGDILSFVMEKQGIDFLGALELLSEMYHIPLEKGAGVQSDDKKRLYQALLDAAEYFQEQLSLDKSSIAYKYIIETRKLSPEAILTFAVGYAPDSWNQTGEYLQKKGHSEKVLVDAGLAISKEGGRGWYDRFRNRIMFPITDRIGRVVGFTARALDKEETAKYINTPETILYKKGSLMYGLFQAKEKILQLDYAVIVEGTMDVISLNSHDIKNVVAPLGTALTDDHIRILKQSTSRILLLLDNDNAGIDATFRSIATALSQGMEVKVATLTQGKDPDEAFANNPEITKQELFANQDAIEFAIRQSKKSHDSTKPHFQKHVADTVLPLISAIDNAIDQESALRQLSTAVDISIDSLKHELNRQGHLPQNTSQNLTTKKQKLTKGRLLWETLVSSLLQLPDSLQENGLVTDILRPLAVTDTSHPLLSLSDKLLAHLKLHGRIDVSSFIDQLQENEKECADLLLLKDLGTMVSNNDSYLSHLSQMVRSIRMNQIKTRIAAIGENIEPTVKDLSELQNLTNQLRDLG